MNQYITAQLKFLKDLEMFKFNLFKTHTIVQPFQGCCIMSFIFHGLTPMVIHIKPFPGYKNKQV